MQPQSCTGSDGADWQAVELCEKLSVLNDFLCLHLNTASYSRVGSDNELIVNVKDLGNWLWTFDPKNIRRFAFQEN